MAPSDPERDPFEHILEAQMRMMNTQMEQRRWHEMELDEVRAMSTDTGQIVPGQYFHFQTLESVTNVNPFRVNQAPSLASGSAPGIMQQAFGGNNVQSYEPGGFSEERHADTSIPNMNVKSILLAQLIRRKTKSKKVEGPETRIERFFYEDDAM